MVTRIEYAGNRRRAEIDKMDDCLWRVWLSDGRRDDTSFLRALTSAQSRARCFIQYGQFPGERRWRGGVIAKATRRWLATCGR